LPGKRFVKQEILGKAKAYLGTDVSLRQVACFNGMPIQYDGSDADPAPALAPSTVWRWLSWLGGLSHTLRAACDLIRQKEPGSALHRQSDLLRAGMYRSKPRRETLERAKRLLVAAPVFERLFGKEIFPRFATAHAWR